ncbi:MAG TPA: ATP-binding protein [Cellulomonas sp.]
MTADVFGTRALRDRVLETWRADPARLREDANTEEDHARGYYRDRVVVELAQNAADAAARAGVPGRLLLRLTAAGPGPDPDDAGSGPAAGRALGAVLVAANTGAPLDAADVASLATMRASASRDRDPSTAGPAALVLGTSGSVPGPGARSSRPAAPALVGRFGVGFAAVRSVADEVQVRSTSGAVRFSLAETLRDLLAPAAAEPRLAAEVARREGSLPALRLPRPAEGRPPEGYDTAVVLTLRDDAATEQVRAMLRQVGDTLLLALPALTEIVVEDDLADHRRRLADVDRRWHRLTAEGELDPVLLAGRPVEERARRAWRLTWALPRDGAGWERVVHAPTPTDDPLDLPALLVGTLPLDATRRHVATGPATDALLDAAAELYARLAEQRAQDGADALLLVPRGLPAGALDGALRERLVEVLSRTPLLPTATGAGPGSEPGLSDVADLVLDLDPTSRRGPDPAAGPGRERDPVPGTDRTDGRGAGTGPGTADRSTVVRPAPAAARLVAPYRAVALAGDEGPLSRALAPWLTGLVLLPPGGLAAARTLGVEVRELADVVDELPAAAGVPPSRWRELYAALAPVLADPVAREALAALPVPLADGRVVRGARGLLLPGRAAAGPDAAPGADAVAVLGRWGVRMVDPAAADPVLERLGAELADPVTLLRHPGVRQAVLDQADEDDLDLADEVTAAVLSLVAAATDRGPDESELLLPSTDETGTAAPGAGMPADPEPIDPGRAVFGLLTLRAADGEPTPAHGLVLPGSVAARLLDPRVLAPVHPDELDRWGSAALVAVGVRADLVALRVPDVVATPGGGALLGAQDPAAELVADSLDGWDEYLELLAADLGEGASVEEVVAVADLDAVDLQAWPAALARLSRPGPLRRALLDPVRSPDGPGSAPSYTAWWLRDRAGLGADHPFALPGAEPALVRLLPPPPAALVGLDLPVLRALGGVDRSVDVPPAAWGRLLRAAGPVGGPVDPAVAGAAWAAWAGRVAGADPADDGLADLDVLPALVAPDRVALVHAEDAAVAAAPMWWQRTDVAAMLPATDALAPAVARLLDLPLATDLADGVVDLDDGDDPGELAPTPPAAGRLLPGVPPTWVEHETLRVDGVPVDWWVEDDGPAAVVHAVHLAGLARGLAQAAGAWSARHLLELALTEPGRGDALAAEQAAEPVLGTGAGPVTGPKGAH